MKPDPRQLKVLLAVAQNGSFSAAAAALNTTQPAVSITIAQLEDRIGGAVVVRDRRGARLTAEGEMLVRHAQAIENVLENAERALSFGNAADEAPLVIAGTAGALLSVVPHVVGMMHGNGLALDISVRDVMDEVILGLLRDRSIDLALCNAQDSALPHDIEQIALMREPFVLVGSAALDLPTQGLSVERAASYPWILPLAEGATRRRLEATFISAGIPLPRQVVYCDDLAMWKELLRRSGFITLTPASLVSTELASGILSSVPLHGGPQPRRLAAWRMRSDRLSPPAERFLTLARRMPDIDV